MKSRTSRTLRPEAWSPELLRVAMSIRPLPSDIVPSERFRLTMRQRLLGLDGQIGAPRAA